VHLILALPVREAMIDGAAWAQADDSLARGAFGC
jgi:hypothetical protein